MNLLEMKKQRKEALDAAEAILAKASPADRNLTVEETKLFEAHMAEAKRFTALISPIEDQSTLTKMFNKQGPAALLDFGAGKPTDPKTVNGRLLPAVDMQRFDMELGSFMRGVSASVDTPVFIGTGAGVESVGATIPTQVLAYLAAYYNLDSFALAGARQLNTDNTIPLALPVVSSGDAASTYAEGAAPNSSQPFHMDAFTFGGAKYSRLVKVSDESLMNSAIPLQGAILDELSAGIASSFTAAITAAMLTALTANASVLVAEGSNDIYHTLIDVMHSVPPRFALPTNRWMCSRAALSKIKDARTVGSGVPFFNPELNQIFGKDCIINDNLTASQVVYGSWADGAIIRKSPFLLLPLPEAFASSGEVGFRATQFLDQHFLCELSGVPNQPLYYTVLS